MPTSKREVVVKNAQYGPESVRLNRWRVLGILAALLVVGSVDSLRAEISVVTDSHGRYIRTIAISESQSGRRLYWTPRSRSIENRFVLNPAGDRFGDSAPVVGEQPGTRQPWVIWSSSDGNDREIAFATWRDGGWQGPAFVENLDNVYDDLNPRLAFDSQGRPVIAWWRNEPTPKIFLSIYRDGVWSSPLLITDPTIPSRMPALRIQGDRAVISFFTASGQTVLYQDLSQISVRIDSNGPLDGPVPPPDANLGSGSGGSKDRNSNCSPNCPDILQQKPQSSDSP
jgi:hypothetical protein